MGDCSVGPADGSAPAAITTMVTHVLLVRSINSRIEEIQWLITLTDVDGCV